jgi:hypothetical protein
MLRNLCTAFVVLPSRDRREHRKRPDPRVIPGAGDLRQARRADTYKNCTSCHRPGEAAPMSLLT